MRSNAKFNAKVQYKSQNDRPIGIVPMCNFMLVGLQRESGLPRTIRTNTFAIVLRNITHTCGRKLVFLKQVALFGFKEIPFSKAVRCS